MSEQRRVLIIGIDGLRPDQFDPVVMPVVADLAAGGVRVAEMHSVYPPHTRAVMASMTTGSTPGRHGLLANVMRAPDGVVDTSDWRDIERLARHDGGRGLFAATLGDLLAERGERLAVAASSSGGVSMLWNPRHLDYVINLNTTFDNTVSAKLRWALGPVPERSADYIDLARTHLVTRAVTDLLLDDPLNRVIVLWIDELDHALHYTGVGSPEATAVMRGIDDCIGAVLDALDVRGLRDEFDVLVMSDHGHTTLDHGPTLADYLRVAERDLGATMAGFQAVGDFIYPTEQEPTPAGSESLAAWLVEQPWADIIFTGHPSLKALPQTVPLRSIWSGQSNSRVPLFAIATRWSADWNEFGVPGRTVSLAGDATLKASHGALSPWDMHGMLIAHGQSFRAGVVSDLPAGATDIMPTVMRLLDLPAPRGIDGRVLHETLRGADSSASSYAEDVIVDASGIPRIRVHCVDATTYIHGSIEGV